MRLHTFCPAREVRCLFLKLRALLSSLQMERLRGLKILCDVGAPLATCAFTNKKLSTAPSEEIGASRKQVAASSRAKLGAISMDPENCEQFGI